MVDSGVDADRGEGWQGCGCGGSGEVTDVEGWVAGLQMEFAGEGEEGGAGDGRGDAE